MFTIDFRNDQNFIGLAILLRSKCSIVNPHTTSVSGQIKTRKRPANRFADDERCRHIVVLWTRRLLKVKQKQVSEQTAKRLKNLFVYISFTCCTMSVRLRKCRKQKNENKMNTDIDAHLSFFWILFYFLIQKGMWRRDGTEYVPNLDVWTGDLVFSPFVFFF